MMALRDILAGEVADNRRAADAAARGQSLTGLSGHHTETESRFAAGPEMFGSPAPVVGEQVEQPRVRRVVPTGVDDLVGDDPIFRERGAVMPDRKPFGAQEQVLAWPAREGYRRYWFNDIPGRVVRAKQAGYAHVIDPSTGSPVSRITGKGDNGRGQGSYLMETPMAWYQEDAARQAAELQQRLDNIRLGKQGADVTVENSYSKISIRGR